MQNGVSRSFVLIALLCSMSTKSASEELPCHFLDSANITDGSLQSDDSIYFEGVVYPKDKYATINFILKDGSETRITVDPYIRGCTCAVTSCLRLCCAPGTQWTKVNGTGLCEVHEEARNFEGEMINEENNIQSVIFDYHFAFVHGKPCRFLYVENNFKVTHEGHILHENKKLNHHDYCFHSKFNNESNKAYLQPLICYTPGVSEYRFIIFPICMLVSVFFITVTIFVYACVPKLRNLQGKILISYLVALAVAYSFLSYIQFNGSDYVRPHFCQSIGFITLFSFFSAFLWLNVMNFDLWLNFRASCCIKELNDKTKFFLYCLYGWGLAGLFTFIILLLDKVDLIPPPLRPGIGQTNCFIDENNKFMYFYLPLGFIFTLNMVLFVSTALKICQLQRELAIKRSLGEAPRNQKNLNKKRDNFILYLRLFCVMGVVWGMEIVSLVSESSYFLLTDVCNTLQGVFIFILFVMTKRVRRLVKERWNKCKGENVTAESASNSASATTYVRLNQMPTS